MHISEIREIHNFNYSLGSVRVLRPRRSKLEEYELEKQRISREF